MNSKKEIAMQKSGCGAAFAPHPFSKHPHQQIHAVTHMVKTCMAIQIHRNLNLRVAEYITQRFDWNPMFDCSGCECMPKCMKICVLDPCYSKQIVQSITHCTGFNDCSAWHSKYVAIRMEWYSVLSELLLLSLIVFHQF